MNTEEETDTSIDADDSADDTGTDNSHGLSLPHGCRANAYDISPGTACSVTLDCGDGDAVEWLRCSHAEFVEETVWDT